MYTLLITKWFLVTAMHIGLVFGNVLAFFALPFIAPWYVSLPLCTSIVTVAFSHDNCVLTNLENKYREKLGWPKIRGFVGHYILSPARKVRRAVLAYLV